MRTARTTLLTTIATVVVLSAVAGCSSDSGTTDSAATDPTAGTTIVETTTTETTTTSADPDASSATDPTASTSDTDTSGAEASVPPVGSPSTVFAAGDVDPALQAYIDLAVADLAERLAIDATAIETHSAVLVVWPDSSLGCAEKGMQYAQAQSDGTLIELAVDGANFRYHAGESTTPFLCQRPLATPPPTLD